MLGGRRQFQGSISEFFWNDKRKTQPYDDCQSPDFEIGKLIAQPGRI